MANESLPEHLPGVDRSQPTLPIGTGGKAPPSGGFKAFMQSAQEPPLGRATRAQSPFDLMQSQSVAASGADLKTLIAQTNSAQTTLGDLNNQLSTSNLKLKQSQRWLLKQKFENSNAHLRSANRMLGNPETPPVEEPSGGGPVTKLLAYVSDGQNQITQANQMLQNLYAKNATMSPADLLLVQIKLAKAQQELEFSSVVLGKAVSGMQTLMNVQL